MKLKLDRCRTCKGVNFYEFEGDGGMGHFPVVWCGDCGTLHKHYFGDTDWTWMAPGPKENAECTCKFIQNDDPTRHFRGCPLREKYPTHEAEKS